MEKAVQLKSIFVCFWPQPDQTCSSALGCGFGRRPISALSPELLYVFAASVLWEPASGCAPLFSVVILCTDLFPSHFLAELPGGSQFAPPEDSRVSKACGWDQQRER